LQNNEAYAAEASGNELKPDNADTTNNAEHGAEKDSPSTEAKSKIGKQRQ
jgi:hypothetical protein